jgi:hypothetical protein
MNTMTFHRLFSRDLRRSAAAGALAVVTAAALTACGNSSDNGGTDDTAASTDNGSSLQEASASITEHTDLLCTGPAVFNDDDSGREALTCVWDYSKGPAPEGELSEVMLWSDSDVTDQAAALQANHDRPGGIGSSGIEMDWSQFDHSGELGGYVEGGGTRGVCTGTAELCSDLADDLGWTFKSNAEIAEEMKAFSGWGSLEEAQEDLREKQDILCLDLDDAPGDGEAAKCGNAILTFGLTVDDLEKAEAFEGTEKSDLSKVEAEDWRMICRNDDAQNCDKVAEYTGEEVTAL